MCSLTNGIVTKLKCYKRARNKRTSAEICVRWWRATSSQVGGYIGRTFCAVGSFVCGCLVFCLWLDLCVPVSQCYTPVKHATNTHTHTHYQLREQNFITFKFMVRRKLYVNLCNKLHLFVLNVSDLNTFHLATL